MVEKSSLYKQIFKVTEIFFTLAWPHGRSVAILVSEILDLVSAKDFGI